MGGPKLLLLPNILETMQFFFSKICAYVCVKDKMMLPFHTVIGLGLQQDGEIVINLRNL